MPSLDRRREIAGAAIDLVAGQGVRALTHRAVDRSLGLPPGSTSYYFRTRRALLDAVVAELAVRAREDFRSSVLRPPDDRTTLEEIAAAIGEYVDRLAERRRAETVARYALTLELHRDAGPGSVVVPGPFSTDAAGALLSALGAEDPSAAARGLVSLLEGLLLERTISRPATTGGAAMAVALYLRGVRTTRAPGPRSRPDGPSDTASGDRR